MLDTYDRDLRAGGITNVNNDWYTQFRIWKYQFSEVDHQRIVSYSITNDT